MYLAGIDLGTTGCKCLVFDSQGNIAGSHYIEYDLIFTPEGVEQDAELWWTHSKAALVEAMRSSNIRPRELKGIAVSSQGIASVPVDSDGNPLSAAISWYDNRADSEAKEMAAQYGADWLLEKTGRLPGSLFFPQVLHIKRTKAALYEKARYFLMAHDYLVYRLCGEALTDYTMASGTLCFDTGAHEWLGEMFDRYAIDRAKFPELKPFGSAAGKILPSVARELGLSEDTLVAVGMQDQKAAALGAGITVEPGIIALSLGTASAVLRLTKEKTVDREGRVFCHAFDGRQWVTENYVGASGSSLKWLRNTLFPNLSYREMDALAEKSDMGAGGLFFYTGLDEKRGIFSGLSLNTSAADLIRAVLEGVAYGVRRRVEEQKESLGATEPVRELRAFGGGAGSGLWCRILADVLGVPVALPRTGECAGMGAAICAGLSLGLFPDEAAFAGFTGGVSRHFDPVPANVRFYGEAYRKFQSGV